MRMICFIGGFGILFAAFGIIGRMRKTKRRNLKSLPAAFEIVLRLAPDSVQFHVGVGWHGTGSPERDQKEFDEIRPETPAQSNRPGATPPPGGVAGSESSSNLGGTSLVT